MYIYVKEKNIKIQASSSTAEYYLNSFQNPKIVHEKETSKGEEDACNTTDPCK